PSPPSPALIFRLGMGDGWVTVGVSGDGCPFRPSPFSPRNSWLGDGGDGSDSPSPSLSRGRIASGRALFVRSPKSIWTPTARSAGASGRSTPDKPLALLGQDFDAVVFSPTISASLRSSSATVPVNPPRAARSLTTLATGESSMADSFASRRFSL